MMSCPSISTWPLLGSTRRLTILRLVVLPQPLGPTSTQMSPAGTVSDRSTTAPRGPYCLLTWRNSTVAWFMEARDAPQLGSVWPAGYLAGPAGTPSVAHRCRGG